MAGELAVVNGSAAPREATVDLLDKIIEQQAAVASRYKPVMTLDEMSQREQAIDYLVSRVMREGIDFGWVPGTKPTDQPKPGEYQAKPTLFKAGAERACAFFGYVPTYETEKQIEEWNSDKFGEPLFYYSYRCTLSKDGHAVGQGLGSATNWESKYRYRNAERTCPNCGAANIRKSKPKSGQREDPGFYCWEKTGGCGATFQSRDERITGQVTGKIPNPDFADTVNTVQKMGQKRAYVAATLTATGLSGRFTQDLEDMPRIDTSEIDTGGHPIGTQAAADAVAQRKIAEMQKQQPAPTAAKSKDFAMLAAFGRIKKDIGEKAYYIILGNNGYEHANEITDVAKARSIYSEMTGYMKSMRSRETDTTAEQVTEDAGVPGEAWEEGRM